METKQLQLVTFEQAKRLKKLGFDWKTEKFYHCHSHQTTDRCGYSDAYGSYFHTPAPTVALALKWVRDEKGIHNGVYFIEFWLDGVHYLRYKGKYQNRVAGEFTEKGVKADTYEAAERVLLDELLTILEKEKKK